MRTVKKKKLDNNEPGGLQLYQPLLDQASLLDLLFTMQINCKNIDKMKIVWLHALGLSSLFPYMHVRVSFGQHLHETEKKVKNSRMLLPFFLPLLMSQ